MVYGLIVKTDNSIEKVDLPADGQKRYPVLRDAVGGMIEFFPINRTMWSPVGVKDIVCNEEYLYACEGRNAVAEEFWLRMWGKRNVVKGDVVFVVTGEKGEALVREVAAQV